MNNPIRGALHFIRKLRSGDLDVNVPLFLLKSIYYHVWSKDILAHHNATVLGIRNIETRGQLSLGTGNISFLNRHDRVFLNIRGKLVIEGNVGVAKGCRIAVDKGAVCILRDCFINGQTNLIVSHGLEIGGGSTIGWGSELLDEDHHTIEYHGKQDKPKAISIGRHVWVGSHVRILKGVQIADNCIVAANSVVTRSFAESNALIAGSPAEIIKRGVYWH